MGKRVVFISGPYRAASWKGIERNIQMAREAAISLWQQGDVVICPHLNTAHFDGLADDGVWLDGDLEILKRCDAIYMLPTWRTSTGSRQEHALALSLGKEIIYA